MPDNCIHQWCNLIYMYLMNIFVPGMLYYGPVVRQVLSWDFRRHLNSLRAMPDNCIHQWCNLIYMYLMNIFVPGMLYYGPVVRQVLSWADVRRPPAPCRSGCHRAWYQSSQAGIGYPNEYFCTWNAVLWTCRASGVILGWRAKAPCSMLIGVPQGMVSEQPGWHRLS